MRVMLATHLYFGNRQKTPRHICLTRQASGMSLMSNGECSLKKKKKLSYLSEKMKNYKNYLNKNVNVKNVNSKNFRCSFIVH